MLDWLPLCKATHLTPNVARVVVRSAPTPTTPVDAASVDAIEQARLGAPSAASGDGADEVLPQILPLDVPEVGGATVEAAATFPTRLTLGYRLDRRRRQLRHYVHRRGTDLHYGGGEVSGMRLCKTGRRLRLGAVDAMGYDARRTDPLYKYMPWYITYDAERDCAFGILYDTVAPGVLDLGREIDAFMGPFCYAEFFLEPEVDLEAATPLLSYYVLHGKTIADVVILLGELTGKAVLQPRYALGYMGSTMAYTEDADAASALADFPRLCKQHGIPSTLFHLSSGYTTDAKGRRQVGTWDLSKIPSPRAMVDSFSSAGIRLAANVKPHLLVSHPRHAEALAAGIFVPDDVVAPGYFWSGGAGEKERGAYLDFAHNADAVAFWQDMMAKSLLDYGIEAIWNDNNEFTDRRDGPLHCLAMNRASFDAVRAARPGLRPMILTRSGAPGIQRYAQTWSGDNRSDWTSLKYNIPMGLSLALSGVGNTGHDIGGFAGDAPDARLLVRWIELGIFLPRFALHSWNDSGPTTSPWMYPETTEAARALILARERLEPYLYTGMHEMAARGVPLMRPLLFDFGPSFADVSFAFMCGPNVLVDPVVEESASDDGCGDASPTGLSTLPPSDAPWVLWDVVADVVGNAALPRGRLGRPVVYARGIVPLSNATVRLLSFPATFTLVEDDGVSENAPATDVVISADADGLVSIRKGPRRDFALPYTHMTVVRPDGTSSTVAVCE